MICFEELFTNNISIADALLTLKFSYAYVPTFYVIHIFAVDHEEESPDRKHCKSCTCCGSTVLLHNDQNNSNKSDKTTETDMSDDLVTVAASRIFNRSGKTQVVKKVCMKTILDEVFDDTDPIPYTSIEKLEEKKKKAQKKGNIFYHL